MALLVDGGFAVELISLSSDDLQSRPFMKVLTGVGLATGTPQASPPPEWFSETDVLHIHNTFPNMSHQGLAQIDAPKVLTVHNYRAFCANGLFLRDGSRCMDCVSGSSLQAVRHGCYRQSRLQTVPVALQQRSPRSLLQLMRNCDRVLLPGEPMRDIFARLGIQDAQVLHNPVSQRDLRPGSSSLASAWLFVGRISPEKGLVDLLQHWPRGEALVVVGEGPQRRVAERISLERRIAVRFLGQRNGQEVSQLMTESLGLIFPSKALEGAPLVYAEAMQAGLPLVAAEGSTLATQTRMDETGMTFSWGEPESLANALRGTRENRPSLAKRAQQIYTDRYTPEAWIAQITKIYETAVSARQRSTDPSA